MAQDEIYRVTVVWSDTIAGKDHTIGLYVNQPNVTGFSIADIGATVKSWWDTELNSSGLTAGMKQLYDPTVSLDHVELRKWDPLDSVVDSYTTGLPIAGTAAGDPLPAEDAVLVSLRTGHIGRQWRGRVYLPAISETFQDGKILGATATDIAQQFKGLVDAFAAQSGGVAAADLVAYSPTRSAGEPVTSIKVDEVIRAQRRRNIRAPSYVTQAV